MPSIVGEVKLNLDQFIGLKLAGRDQRFAAHARLTRRASAVTLPKTRRNDTSASRHRVAQNVRSRCYLIAPFDSH
jgi:hypothetical protein